MKLAPLLPYFRPYRGRVVLGIATLAAAAALGLLAPLLIGSAVDALRSEVSRSRLASYAGLILLVAMLQGVFSYAQRMTLVTLSRSIERDLRQALLDRLLRLPLSYFQAHHTGDLMARSTSDLAAVRMVCGPAILYGGHTLFVATGALLLLFHIHTRLTLVALVSLPLVAIATKILGARIHSRFERVQSSFGELSALVQENFSGVRVVRAYARELAEERAFGDRNERYVAENRRLIAWSAAFHPLLQALVGLGFVTVLAYGGHLVRRGEISVGGFVTFNLFLGKLVWPMIAIGWVSNLLERGTASFQRLQEILEAVPAIRDEPKGTPRTIVGALQFRGLTFAYPGRAPVLHGIEITVPAASTLAIVGRTGSGKSTLLALVPRLFDPPRGSVCVDGCDVRDLSLASLRGAVAMVPQETFLFSASLRENIAFGRPDADDAAVAEAVRLAGLASDLARFPAGLETRVGERGITLSGGQKQRVALARALLLEPKILLLDDCLSAVDAETEERILGNLAAVFRGRTVVMVSHRMSAVAGADRIVVLDEGRVVEQGRHAQLVEQGSMYAELCARQRLEEELAVV
jgi:ATP-binding cassette, subfamily B, multidrug efflux pump